jgi:hypothetical protein
MGIYYSKTKVIPIVIIIPKYNHIDQSPQVCLKKYRISEPDELPRCFDKNCPDKHIQNTDKFYFDRYMK